MEVEKVDLLGWLQNKNIQIIQQPFGSLEAKAKRYRRRDGKISGVIEAYPGEWFQYQDSENQVKYTRLGELNRGEKDDWDLIEEVCNS